MHGMCSKWDSVRKEQRYERWKQSGTIFVCILFQQIQTKTMKKEKKKENRREQNSSRGRKIQIVTLVTSSRLRETVKIKKTKQDKGKRQ